MLLYSEFRLQSTAYFFRMRDTLPILTALSSAYRYRHKSIASTLGDSKSRVPCINMLTLRWSKMSSRCEHVRTARPMTCSNKFILYQGSIMWTWRIFLKSRPSDPAFVIIITFTTDPSEFCLSVAAIISFLVSGEIRGSPDTII